MTIAVDLAYWQQTILRAFQTWANYANINIHEVPDQGQPPKVVSIGELLPNKYKRGSE